MVLNHHLAAPVIACRRHRASFQSPEAHAEELPQQGSLGWQHLSLKVLYMSKLLTNVANTMIWERQRRHPVRWFCVRRGTLIPIETSRS